MLESNVEILPSLDKDSVMETVFKAARRFSDKGISAVGVNIPGLADPRNGIWLESCFSGIRNIPIARILSDELSSDKLSLPVFIDNDVNNCALAESLFGGCRGVSDFVWLTVSNGCGGALYLNGSVYGGVRNTSGEFGHIIVEEDAKRALLCGCGNYGCLEAQAAGPGIAKRYFALAGTEADAEAIAALAKSGDAAAQKVFSDEGVYIGRALAAVINAVNPAKAVLGGGVSKAFELFEPSMTETIKSRTYKLASEHVRVEKTALGYDAALIGAAALAIKGSADEWDSQGPEALERGMGQRPIKIGEAPK